MTAAGLESSKLDVYNGVTHLRLVLHRCRSLLDMEMGFQKSEVNSGKTFISAYTRHHMYRPGYLQQTYLQKI